MQKIHVNKLFHTLLLIMILAGGTMLLTNEESDASTNTACYLEYYGNWDMHVGGCWMATPFNCTDCAIPGWPDDDED